MLPLFTALTLAAAAEPPRPNVLFVAVDDLKPLLGCYGDPHAKTPNLDRLAARGTVFNRAYCQQAVCSPSRSSLMTGRRPDSTQVYDLVTHFRKALPDVVTIPQHFKAHGYHTQGVGKIYHGGYNDPPSWTVPWEGSKGAAYGPVEQRIIADRIAQAKAQGVGTGNQKGGYRGHPTEAAEVPDDYLMDGWTANRTVEILRDLKGKKEPFFLGVGFAKPHLPFVAPKKYWDLYDPTTLPVATNPDPPKDAPAFALAPWGELRNYFEVPKSGPISAAESRTLVHGYYAAVSYMDAMFGRVLDELDRLELAKNTVVVVWGDHGWHFGDHGQWCKHTNYEQATRSALLMSAPGQKSAGGRTDALVEFVDIYPTLAEVCRLPAPEGVEGQSFAALLDDPRRAWKPAAFSQYPRTADGKQYMGYAMRTDQYRLVEWRNRTNGGLAVRELYDHLADPDENVNLANLPEHKETIDRLSKQLAAGWKSNHPTSR